MPYSLFVFFSFRKKEKAESRNLFEIYDRRIDTHFLHEKVGAEYQFSPTYEVARGLVLYQRNL